MKLSPPEPGSGLITGPDNLAHGSAESRARGRAAGMAAFLKFAAEAAEIRPEKPPEREPQIERSGKEAISPSIRAIVPSISAMAAAVKADSADNPTLRSTTLAKVAKRFEMGEKLLTTAQIADELSVTTEQVRRFVSDGELHPINVGRQGAKRQTLRFDDEDVRAFKERRKLRGTCQPSTKRSHRRTTRPTSGSTETSFTARLERRAAEKLRPKLIVSNKHSEPK
jgi:hypothetical protein